MLYSTYIISWESSGIAVRLHMDGILNHSGFALLWVFDNAVWL